MMSVITMLALVVEKLTWNHFQVWTKLNIENFTATINMLMIKNINEDRKQKETDYIPLFWRKFPGPLSIDFVSTITITATCMPHFKHAQTMTKNFWHTYSSIWRASWINYWNRSVDDLATLVGAFYVDVRKPI